MDRISEIARKIQYHLGKLPEQLNSSIMVVKRRRCFCPRTLAQTFILALLQKPTANDADIAAVAATLGVSVTPQAIEQRYSARLATFFQNLFAQIATSKLRVSEPLCELFRRFTEVIAIDSTVIALPAEMASEFPGCGGGGPSGGNVAALRLQTEIDLRTGALVCVQTECGRNSDTASDRQQVEFKKGSLRLADLGYFSVEVLARIVASLAHFVSRVQFKTCIQIDGQVQSVIDYLISLKKETGLIDKPILLGKTQRLACRLIAWRVPEEIAQRRRRTLYQSYGRKGKTPTKSALAACEWNMLVTDMASDKLTVQEAIVLYRSRWQIELLFKRWKSHCRIDLMDGRTLVHVKCRLWIRLCAAVIQQQLIAASCWGGEQVLSFAKVSNRLQEHVISIALSLGATSRLAQTIKTMVAQVSKTCRYRKRSNKPGWFELLRDPSKLEYTLTWR